MDLTRYDDRLERLIEEDQPSRGLEQLAELMKAWSGPMSEARVRALGNYLDPSKKRRWGAPKKEKPNGINDSIMMHVYFEGIKRKEPDPIQFVASCYGLPVSKKGRCTAFEHTRSRFNKRIVSDFFTLLRISKMTGEQVELYLQKHREIPAEYWSAYIRPKY